MQASWRSRSDGLRCVVREATGRQGTVSSFFFPSSFPQFSSTLSRRVRPRLSCGLERFYLDLYEALNSVHVLIAHVSILPLGSILGFAAVFATVCGAGRPMASCAYWCEPCAHVDACTSHPSSWVKMSGCGSVYRLPVHLPRGSRG